MQGYFCLIKNLNPVLTDEASRYSCRQLPPGLGVFLLISQSMNFCKHSSQVFRRLPCSVGISKVRPFAM